ncbi:ABC transporter permease [Martelella alba]|uniref:ABC transporter permease n=2 Tax=Martelella alba TaxID=2590451 RepID=A0A506U1Q0_9HYPH|nr:ABC transporter permease [Martelella alba]
MHQTDGQTDQQGKGALAAKPGKAKARASRPAALNSRAASRALIALILPLVVIIIWQFSGTNGSLFGGVLPTPDRVLKGWNSWALGSRGMGLNAYSGTWWNSLSFSTIRVMEGFAVAIVIAIPTGIIIGWNRLAAEALDPTIQLLRPVPITAWLPFSIAVFGVSSFGAIFLIALGAFYPIVINTTQGARNVEKNLVRAARMLGASQKDVLLKVVVPSALPAIFTGLRIGLGIGWTAVIVAEMVAVKSGLGYVLWDAYYVGRMDIVIADMITIGLMGLISDRILLLIEYRLLAWRRAGGTH